MQNLADWVAGILFLAGAFFSMGAGLGVLRMPDFLNRMHAASKASTMGAILMSLGAAFHFRQWDLALLCFLILFSFLLTSPIAGHLLGRAALRAGTPYLGKDPWEGRHGNPGSSRSKS